LPACAAICRRRSDHYAFSLVTYRSAGLRKYVGPLLNNMGLVYTQLEQFEKAHEAYDDARSPIAKRRATRRIGCSR
jgi:hypothetical protein